MPKSRYIYSFISLTLLFCNYSIPPACLNTKLGVETPISSKKADLHRLWYRPAPTLVRWYDGVVVEEWGRSGRAIME